MPIKSLIQQYHSCLSVTDLQKKCIDNKRTFAKNIVGSGLSLIIMALYEVLHRPILVVMDNKEQASYLLNDLESITEKSFVPLLFYPSSRKQPYQIESTDNANVMTRIETLHYLQNTKNKNILITYPEAISEKVITQASLKKNIILLNIHQELSISKLTEILFEAEFQKVDFVTQPGEFSVRGGIIDVFSYSNELPCRIEFFGDEIDSLRLFDIATQLSQQEVSDFEITPNVDNIIFQEMRISLFDYIGQDYIPIIKNIDWCLDTIDTAYKKAEDIYDSLEQNIKQLSPKEFFCHSKTEVKHLQNRALITLSNSNKYFQKVDFETIDFKQHPQPTFNKNFELLIDNLNENTHRGIRNYLNCSSSEQIKRFEDIFANIGAQVTYQPLTYKLSEGFVDAKNIGVAIYTDHQIFERFHRFHLKNTAIRKEAFSLKELHNLQIGDYVTHIDHGVGKFSGLRKIKVGENIQETIQLVYGDNDILFVNIHSLHKISKYSGKDGVAPKLHKLGNNVWSNLKKKTKKRVKEIAFDLINLYAKRRVKKGFQYAPDSYLQHELEASFIYEDTPDQLSVTQEVKKDMENTIPMDRLICGDVGFGKTEIAIRAAFKAVDNNKQVAVLVPTTILAFQHYKTFQERLKDFPVNIDYLNRFRTARDRTQIIKNLEDGKLDVVIGTQQLINKALKYKDLGLLIVDEEHKFGVGVKDKLKTIKENVDVLTLTATPIPRTLQFSLMAARDLSIIRTAPPNRYPIDNQFISLNEETIRDAITYELSRDGQVFFIHNHINTLPEVCGMIQRLVPDAKVVSANGQMDGKKLEEVMLKFMNGAHDVLVSTSIIENGLDVPNANTMFINNAHKFGLSDLHQMRGRVGRSNKKAFCYFVTVPQNTMALEARRRMEAIETFSELGSGFDIAMKDLEIRGAGDLLGGEQSGFINDMGFETYQKIMQETIEELKQSDFKELYEDEDIEVTSYVSEVQIDTDWEILIPDTYIQSPRERFSVYQELNEVKDEKGLMNFKTNIADRFGKMPAIMDDLIFGVQLKWMAQQLSMDKIIVKNNQMSAYFLSDQQSKFYSSPQFQSILGKINNSFGICTLKEKNTKNGPRLICNFKNINGVKIAFEKLQTLLPIKYV